MENKNLRVELYFILVHKKEELRRKKEEIEELIKEIEVLNQIYVNMYKED